MNFRLPFQISRVSAICQSSSPLNLISKFTPIYKSNVKNTKQDKQNGAHRTRIITTRCSYMKFDSPFNIFQQKAFLHDLAKTEEAVRQRVREQQCCDCKCNEEPLELAFRQTCKVECMKCMDRKPYLAPPLVRPPKFYDDSQCLFEHKCNPECNTNPPRMDDLYCCQYEKKQLPCLATSLTCLPCLDVIKKPLIAPRLVAPPKWYDTDKMKWDHGVCKEPPCVRRDDACGYKILPKELPALPSNNCMPPVCCRPLTAPILRRPPIRYNPECIPYAHTTCPANDAAPRRDECLFEPMYKELPVLPPSHYIPCEQPPPTKCPQLRRPLARYNPMEMEYKHEYPYSPCDTPSLRRDNNNNIISVTLTKKKLPPLSGDNVCQPCIDYRPLTAPPLGRPKLFQTNLYEEQKRSHCFEDRPIRRDGHIKIYRKCLPKVPIAHCSRPCMDIFTPCTTPTFVPPIKLYDDSKCSYRHDCSKIGDDPPPRRDDYCLRINRKPLPKAPCSPYCRPSPDHPKTSPKLGRPDKWYDDTKLKYQHPECPEDPCTTIPRADIVTGYRDEVKELQPFKALKCKVCQQSFPFKSPKLCRPHARYDDSCMLYDHKDCPPPCDGSCFRRDNCLWEGPKKLPPIRCGTLSCQNCQQCYPSVAPPLNRPKRLYDFPQDPIRVKKIPPECTPRRDDIFCWRPRRKKLPSFKDCCNQCCCFSSFSWVSSKNNSVITKTTGGERKAQPKQENYTNNINKETKDSEKLQPILKEKNSNDQYYIVKEPTWKCMDATMEKKTRKIYDYSIEKWLRKGAEYLINSTPNVKSKSNINTKKQSKSNISSQPKYTCKYCSETRCMTPLKFTGFDNSESNHFYCIKKNKKLQPLKVGSAFKSKVTSSKADTCIPKTVKFNEEQLQAKSTSSKEVAPKQLNKHSMIHSIIQEHIHHIPSMYKMRTNNFVLNLNNKMRSTLFQKISNFFKNREKAARKAIKNKPSPTIQQNDIAPSNKEFIDNICDKYNVEFDKSKMERNNNKAYFVQKFKNKNTKTETDKKVISSNSTNSKTINKKEEQPTKIVAKSILKKMKMKTDQIRNYSTQSQAKGGPLNYKHVDISDDYIGKIYKVKLKKIGVKNLMLEKNDPKKRDEEPHTICYICKVVPKYQPIIHEEEPDIENVKINYYREKRNTIE